MRGIISFLKSTLLGGVVVLLPIVVLLAIGAWAVNLAINGIEPVLEWLPDRSVGGVSLSALAAFGILIAVCFVAGLFAETAILKRVRDGAGRIALFVPGYALPRRRGLM